MGGAAINVQSGNDLQSGARNRHKSAGKQQSAPQMFNKSMVVRGKQKLVRELDQAKHRGQLLAHKKKRVLLDLLKLVKDRQMV